MAGYWSRGILAAMFVALTAAPSGAADAAAKPVDFELLLWQAIEHRTEASDFRFYLAIYPHGRFSQTAKDMDRTLSAAKPAPSSLLAPVPTPDNAVSPFGDPLHWVHERKLDCWAHVRDPNNDQDVVWSGSCRRQKIQGTGALLWMLYGKIGKVTVGTFVDGVMTGPGQELYRSGARLEGEFLDLRLNGHGRYAYADGGQEEGEYKDGKLDGYAVVQFSNGFRAEGIFQAGKYNGRMVLRYPNGDVVDGGFKAGVRDGLVKLTFANGGVLEANFVDGVAHGHTKFTSAGKFSLEGQYDKGKPIGDWTIVDAAGTKLVGPYVAPKRDPDRSLPIDDLYPPISRRLGETGRTLIRMTVKADGSLTDVAVDQSSGFERLDEAAILAVTTRYVFQPATVGGHPVVMPDWKILITWRLSE